MPASPECIGFFLSGLAINVFVYSFDDILAGSKRGEKFRPSLGFGIYRGGDDSFGLGIMRGSKLVLWWCLRSRLGLRDHALTSIVTIHCESCKSWR